MCKICKNSNAHVVKKGFFLKKRQRRVQRYQCKTCGKSFSDQTGSLSYRLRKYHLRNRVFRLLCSGVSQRRAAYNLQVHPDTVATLMERIAISAAEVNRRVRSTRTPDTVVFDEMETFEHSKCKPVGIAVAVEEGTRQILVLRAAQMPAKGRLAKISRKRYGPRADQRPRAIRETFEILRENPQLETLKSDESPRYPTYIRAYLPGVTHKAYKGRRGCVVGQGELKSGGFDPLFSLNHTCAEVRDSIKRLTRRTWCTTKLVPCLQMLLEIFQCYFNQKLAGVRSPTIP